MAEPVDESNVNEMGLIAQMAAQSGFKRIEVAPEHMVEMVGEIRRLKAELEEAKESPGAALLAAYPHVFAIEAGNASGSTIVRAEMMFGGWWGVQRTTIDDALRDAEARAARAWERMEEQ